MTNYMLTHIFTRRAFWVVLRSGHENTIVRRLCLACELVLVKIIRGNQHRVTLKDDFVRWWLESLRTAEIPQFCQFAKMLIDLQTPFFSALLYYDNIIKLVRAMPARGPTPVSGRVGCTGFSCDHSVVVW